VDYRAFSDEFHFSRHLALRIGRRNYFPESALVNTPVEEIGLVVTDESPGSTGSAIGYVDLQIYIGGSKGNSGYVDYVKAVGGRKFSVGEVKQILRKIKGLFPSLSSLTGDRISGAKSKSESIRSRLQSISLSEFSDLLNIYQRNQ
jgi:hypothetical protein